MMSLECVLKEVLFDRAPLGLAEAMAALPSPVAAIVQSEEDAQPGETLYFGIETPAESVIEAAGIVETCTPDESGFRLRLRVESVDAANLELARQILEASQPRKEPGKQPVWGLGHRQMNGSYAVVVNAPAGVLTAQQLERLAQISAQGAGLTKMTHAQRMILLVREDQIESARAAVEAAGLKIGVLHKGVRNIRACCGELCRFAQGTNALDTAAALEQALFGRGTEFDVKIAVSDCPRNCVESYCADIGLLGGKGEYAIVVGGRGSMIPFRAVHLTSGIAPHAVPATVTRIINWYEQHAQRNERFWKVLQRLGETEAKNADFSAVEAAFRTAGDKVDEAGRVRDLLARVAGASRLRHDLGL